VWTEEQIENLCLAFVQRQPNWRQATQEGRVKLIRVLAEYMIRYDIPAYTIDRVIVTNQHEDFKPYIFTHKQISDIFIVHLTRVSQIDGLLPKKRLKAEAFKNIL